MGWLLDGGTLDLGLAPMRPLPRTDYQIFYEEWVVFGPNEGGPKLLARLRLHVYGCRSPRCRL